MFEVQWEVKIYQFGLIFVHETTICNINRFVLQECADFNWRVSDCEELVRVTQRRWWGLFYGFILYYSIGILRIFGN